MAAVGSGDATTAGERPVLRIVTIVFHPGEELLRFEASIAAATTRDTRLVVVNNGPTNDVLRRVAARPGVDVVDAAGNVGYGSGANLGVEGATGDWVVVSNPDILLEAGCLDLLIRAGERETRAGALGPRLLNTDRTVYPSARAVPSLRVGAGHALFARVWPGNPWSRRYQVAPDEGSTVAVGWLSGAMLLLRLEAFRAVGGFDERYFMFFEDLDLGERLGAAGWSNLYVPEACAVHDQGTSWRSSPAPMIRAHHRSARLYVGLRYDRWYEAPVRAALWLALRAREELVVRRGRST